MPHEPLRHLEAHARACQRGPERDAQRMEVEEPAVAVLVREEVAVLLAPPALLGVIVRQGWPGARALKKGAPLMRARRLWLLR